MPSLKDVAESFADDPTMVDKSFDEEYIIILFTKFTIGNDIAFDIIGPYEPGTTEHEKLKCVNILDRIAPDCSYSAHTIKGRPIVNLNINPTLQDWEASANERVFLRYE